MHPLHKLLNLFNRADRPFLCVITPVFDEALIPLKALVNDLQSQDCSNFIHVSISNGPSPKINQFLSQINTSDSRFIYVELKRERERGKALQRNLSKRKNYCMKQYPADRYLFIDADSAVISPHAIAVLYVTHFITRSKIIVCNIIYKTGVLPVFPVDIGRIDITNFSFSRQIALENSYPERPPSRNLEDLFYNATDYFFFKQIHNKNNTLFLPFIYLHKDKRMSYKTVAESIS